MRIFWLRIRIALQHFLLALAYARLLLRSWCRILVLLPFVLKSVLRYRRGLRELDRIRAAREEETAPDS